MSHKHLNGALRVLVVPLFLAATMALGGFAFASSASAAGGSGPAWLSATAQQCDEDAVGCDYLGDYGIGCINGDIVGDVDGTAINCDVDGDVNGTGINSDATGNMENCINGDPSSVSGSSINCGDFAPGAGPGPNPNPNPQPNPEDSWHARCARCARCARRVVGSRRRPSGHRCRQRGKRIKHLADPDRARRDRHGRIRRLRAARPRRGLAPQHAIFGNK